MMSQQTNDDDEWEEVVLVNGVLDANNVRQAVGQGNVSLRSASSSQPILQISNSLYTGKWVRTIGTDIILECDNNQMKILSTTDRYLKTEKALLTAKDGNQANGQSQPNKLQLKAPKSEQK